MIVGCLFDYLMMIIIIIYFTGHHHHRLEFFSLWTTTTTTTITTKKFQRSDYHLLARSIMMMMLINYKQGDEEFVGCETNYQMFFFFFSAIWPMANHHWSVIIIIKLSLIRGKTFEKKTNKQPNRHDICYTLTKKLVIEDIFSICVWNVKKFIFFFNDPQTDRR